MEEVDKDTSDVVIGDRCTVVEFSVGRKITGKCTKFYNAGTFELVLFYSLLLSDSHL